MKELDHEKIRLLGRHQITYRADTGLFYSPEELPEETKAQIRSDGMAYVETARFLTRGSDAVNCHTALSWWSHLQPVPIEEGPCVPLRDRNIYESIQLDWEEREVCITDPGTDMEMRELRGPKRSGISVFYPYDPTLSKDTREFKPVTYWLIEMRIRDSGYADALTNVADALEHQQELMDAIIGFMGEQYDSAELYDILHNALAMSNEDILSLGFDPPQSRERETEMFTKKPKGRKSAFYER